MTEDLGPVEPAPDILVLRRIAKRYGELSVLDNVSLSVARGARHVLIGPNGAGKSSLFHVIAGTVRPSSGHVLFEGEDVTRRREYRRAQLGIGRTFQQSSLFDGLTVLENVVLAVQQRAGLGHRFLRGRRYLHIERRSAQLLEEVGIAQYARREASSLAYGPRRQLEIAIALATEPRLLLMDEPTAGMSREEANGFLELIVSLPQELTLVIVEHDMDVVFGLATWISVLDAGRLIADGTPESIRGSSEVQEAYLGKGDRMEQLFQV